MDDPFKPPAANLEVPRELTPAPPPVRGAFAALCTSVGATLLMLGAMAIGVVPLPPGAPFTMTALSNLAGAAIMGFFAWKVRTGRNWARWVLAVFTALGTFGWVFSIFVVPAAWRLLPVAHAVVGLTQFALQVVAAILVFTPRANAWYRDSR